MGEWRAGAVDEAKKQGRRIKKIVHIRDGIGNLMPCTLIFKMKFKKKMVRNNDVKIWRQRKVTEHLCPSELIENSSIKNRVTKHKNVL